MPGTGIGSTVILSFSARGYVHHLIRLIPGNGPPRPMGAEHGIRRIVDVCVRIVAGLTDDFLLIVAGPVTPEGTGEVPVPFGIGGDLSIVAPHFAHWSPAAEQNALRGCGLRISELASHALDIGHCPASLGRRDLQQKIVPGLQKTGRARFPGFAQGLADRPVGGLAEVTAFSMLQVGSPGFDGDPHVRYGCSRKSARMLPLRKVRHDESLPVGVQHVCANG